MNKLHHEKWVARSILQIAWCCPLLIASSVPAPAQDWAKARLERSPRHLEWVKVKHGEAQGP